jgi:hypothetical protein
MLRRGDDKQLAVARERGWAFRPEALTWRSQRIILRRKHRSSEYAWVPSCWPRPSRPKRAMRTGGAFDRPSSPDDPDEEIQCPRRVREGGNGRTLDRNPVLVDFAVELLTSTMTLSFCCDGHGWRVSQP